MKERWQILFEIKYCTIILFFCVLSEVEVAAFTARRYACAVYAVIMCPSVCLSVRPYVCHTPETVQDREIVAVEDDFLEK